MAGAAAAGMMLGIRLRTGLSDAVIAAMPRRSSLGMLAGAAFFAVTARPIERQHLDLEN